MKKIQCEVCGSTDIKKIDDAIFECQSCGVQYSKDEVQKLLVEITGKVRIDHSEEVANAVKRGEQFENAGNAQKAEEYYNKALDMDADNQEVQQRARNAATLQEVEKYYIIDPEIDPEQNVKDFFKQLATTENIACDIYKEIAIKSVTECYRPFYLIKMRCEYTWSAIACYKYYEEQTVYETVHRDGRSYKEPTTKKVARVERIPRNGSYTHGGEGFFVASHAIHNSFQSGGTDLKNAIIQDFEKLQYEKYSSCAVNHIDISLLDKKDEKYLYKGFELDLNTDSGVYDQKTDQLGEIITNEASASIQSSIGGDYFENYRMSGKVADQSVIKVLVPVQVIEYTYKGETYAAVSDLLSHTTTMPMSYPCDVELSAAMEDLETQKERASKTPGVTAALVMMGIGLLFLFCGMVFPSAVFIVLMIVLEVVGLLTLLISVLVQGSRQKKFEKCAEDVKGALFNPRIASLEAGRDRFFEQYTDYASAKAAAADVDCMEIRSARPELSVAGALRKKMAYVTADEVESDETEETLRQGVKEYKRKRNRKLYLSLFGGVIVGIAGLLILCNDAGVWHYTVWGLSVLMIAGGFGMALIGSIVIMGNMNRKIIDLQNCRSAYIRQKFLESEFEQIQQTEAQPLFPQWTPERIAQKTAEVSEQKQKNEAKKEARQKMTPFQKVIAELREHKKLAIILASIAAGLVIAIVTEVIVVNSMAHSYEEKLYGKAFSDTEYITDHRITATYRFSNDGTYVHTWMEDDRITNEYSGTYKIRFALFSGEPRLIFDNSWDQEVQIDGQGGISAFEEYGDWYRLDETNDEIGNISDGNEVLNTGTSTTNNSTLDSTNQTAMPTESDEATKTTSSVQNKTSTSSKPDAGTTAKPHSSTQATAKPTVKADPCANGHSWKAATCTEPATCTNCHETRDSANGHSWQEATCSAPKTCLICKATEGSALPHNMYYTRCTKCRYSDFSEYTLSSNTFCSDSWFYLDGGSEGRYLADGEASINIDSKGVCKVTFDQYSYTFTLVQSGFSNDALKFNCYMNGEYLEHAEVTFYFTQNRCSFSLYRGTLGFSQVVLEFDM